MEELKKYDEFMSIATGFTLTDLIIQPKTKRKSKKDLASRFLLEEYLRPYGIYPQLLTRVYNLDKTISGSEVIGCKVDKNIPIENFSILKQMYGFEESLINIIITSDENRQYCFWMNTDTNECELERLEFGSIKFSKKYPDFKEMMDEKLFLQD